MNRQLPPKDLASQSTSLKFELVLPCYNESKSLEQLVKRSIQGASRNGFSQETARIVLVENGSKDNSIEILQRLEKDIEIRDWIRVVIVEKNMGYGYGLWMGLKTTTAPLVGWTHADQQCDPSDAFLAANLIQGKTNTLVKGIRKKRAYTEIFVSRIFDLIASLTLRHLLFEINAQPKVFNRALLSGLNPPNDFSFDLYMLYMAKKSNYSFQTIMVNFPPRIHGLSNWANSFSSRYKTILKMIRYIFYLAKNKNG